MDQSVSVCQYCKYAAQICGQTYIHLVQFVLIGAPHGVHEIIPFADDADCLVSVVRSLYCYQTLANEPH